MTYEKKNPNDTNKNDHNKKEEVNRSDKSEKNKSSDQDSQSTRKADAVQTGQQKKELKN